MKEETTKDKFLSKFKELGYESQISIVRAIMEKSDHYSNKQERSLSACFNQILLGHRPLPKKMEDCLISLSKDDSLVTELCKVLRNKAVDRKSITDDEIVEKGMCQIIDGNISILKTSIKHLGNEARILILKEFSHSIANINTKIDEIK